MISSLLLAQEGNIIKNQRFIENLGQWESNIVAKVDVSGGAIYFEKDRFHYQFINTPQHKHEQENENNIKILSGHIFETQFIGANVKSEILKKHPSNFHFNYFLRNDRSKWKGEVRSYSEITYKEFYSGIDLKIYQTQQAIKYDFLLAPGASLNTIQSKYIGVNQPTIRNGNLIINHSLGELIEKKPYAYQFIEGKKVEVLCVYNINKDGSIGFVAPNGYDKSKELIIDPELIFSTYSGSFADNFGESATYDFSGNAYMGGLVFSNNYITTPGAFSTIYNGGVFDIAISKFASDSAELKYATYLGGSQQDMVHSMVTDSAENLYIFGVTGSTDFPTTLNGYDTIKEVSSFASTEIGSFNSGTDIIVSKFNKNGSQLLGSTFFGGNNNDGINLPPGTTSNDYDSLRYNYGDSHRGEIVLDDNNNVYIGTSTSSTNLPLTNSLSGNQDGLVLKFNTDLSNLIFARAHGGSASDAIYSLKVIENNKLLVGGGTTSFTDFPTTLNAYITNSIGGSSDGFISIISADGLTVEKSTFIGTSSYDQVYFIEFDRFNNVYGFGQTKGNFPNINAPLAIPDAGQFFVKLDSNLSGLTYSTTFGSGSNEINISPTAFLVDRCQNIYASGWGGRVITGANGEGLKPLVAANMTLENIQDSSYAQTDGNDFYLYVLNRDIDSVLYASFFGGTNSRDHVDGGTSRFDKEGIIYQGVCASCGSATNDFPTKKAFSTMDNSSNCNNAIFKFDFEILPRSDLFVSRTEGCTPFTITLKDSSKNATELFYDFYGTTVNDFGDDTTFTLSTPGTYLIEQIARDTFCNSEARSLVQVIVRSNDLTLDKTADTTVCNDSILTLTAISNKANTKFTWSQNRNFSFPLNTPNDSTISFRPDKGRNVFYIRIEEDKINPCDRIDSVVVNYLDLISEATISEDTICEKSAVQFDATLQAINKFKWDFGNGTLDSLNEDRLITYNNAGVYSIQLVTSNTSCNFTDTIPFRLVVEQNNLQIPTIGDTVSCNLNPILLSQNSNGSAKTFHWSSSPLFSDTLNNYPNDSTIIANPLDTANYYIKIADKFCSLKDTLQLDVVNYQLTLNALQDSACSPFPIQIQSITNGLDSFRFVTNTGFSSSTNASPNFTLENSGIYTFELRGYNKRCQYEDTLTETIEIFDSVRVSAITSPIICEGDSVVLTGNSFGTAKEFIWSTSPSFTNPINVNNDSIIKVSPPANTTYYFRANNVICFSDESATVSIDELDIALNDFESICLEDTLLISSQVITGTQPLTYSWESNPTIISGQQTSSILIEPKNNQFYYLETVNNRGCEDFDTIEVEVNTPAFTDAEIIAEDSLFAGQSTTLSTNRNGSNLVYEWEPVTNVVDPNSATTTTKLDETRTYQVTITDLNTGCEVVALRRLFVFEVNCGKPDIFVPTAFTPDNDLTNDILYVRGANISTFTFQLFNRWGELVFETSDLNQGWDGTFKGEKINPGVFAYQLNAVCFDGQEFYDKGNITLIR